LVYSVSATVFMCII